MQESGLTNTLPQNALCLVAPNQLETVWPQIRNMVDEIVEAAKERMTARDILGFLLQNKMLLWAWVSDNKIAAIMLGEVAQFPQLKMLRIIGCVGEGRAEFEGEMPKILDFARQIGCRGVEGIVRSGWSKALQKYGFKHTHEFIEVMFD